MDDKHVFLVKTSLFGKTKVLTLNPEFVALGETENSVSSVNFAKMEIEGYRYAARRVRYYVYIYSYYNIDIKINTKILRLRFFSLLGLKRKETSEKYAQILNLLYSLYFRDMTKYYLQLFSNNVDFEICGLIFTNKGIIYSKKDPILNWEDVVTRNYATYYSIYSKNNGYYYRTFNYQDDWNTSIIYTVSRSILINKGLWKE